MSLRVGLVGAGAAGRLHALGYLSAAHPPRLVAVADIDLERARKMRRRFGFEDAMSDHHGLLARGDIDVVSVCTPAASHAGIVLDAISASKHVLCEKPISTTAAGARAIAVAASENPELCVSGVFQHRDDPALRRAHWLLEQRAVGNVVAVHLSARVRRDDSYYANLGGQQRVDGGGALMVQGIHLLDALIWLAGPVQSVSATMDTFVHKTDAEDTIAGWARLATGAVVTLECTTCAQRDEYSIDVLGDTSSLRLDYRPGWARTWELRVRTKSWHSDLALRWKAQLRFPREGRVRARHVAELATGRLTQQHGIPSHLGHGPHVRRFLRAIENGEPPPVPTTDAARGVEAVIAFYRSAREGEPVRLSPTRSRGEP